MIRPRPPRGLLAGLLLGCFILLADQVTKLSVLALMLRAQGPIAVMPGFNLVLVWNKGVSFGLLSGHDAKMALILLTIVVIIFLLLWLNRATGRLVPLALGLIIGGAGGNLVDRLHFGAVADFLDVYVGTHHWPAFNLADSAIVTGVGLLVLDSLLPRRSKP